MNHNFITRGLRILYPQHCALCDRLLSRQETDLCRACADRLHYSGHLFAQGFAAFSYTGPYKESVLRFKYGGRPEYAAFYAKALLAVGQRTLQQWRPEILLPVPIHPARLRERGYNQAEELAKALSAGTGILWDGKRLQRCRNTKPLKELSPKERQATLQDAFAPRGRKSLPHRVVLVDDIYTTGSTLKELEKVVRQMGAEEVHAVCICEASSAGQ